jgi:hypothetical protein
MRKTLSRVISLALLALLMSSPAHAQGNICASLLAVEGDAHGYRDRGNRCEGVYEAYVGSPTLDIVSLTQGGISYPLDAGVNLTVSGVLEAELHVRAVAKSPQTFYQMDALLGAGESLQWPVSEVLLPQNLSDSRVGVFSWKEEAGKMIYVPVQIRDSASELTLGATDFMLLSIRPSFSASKIVWRSSGLQENGACEKFGEWQSAVPENADAGDTVNLDLSVLAGQNCIEIAAQRRGAFAWITTPLQVEFPSP